MKFVILSAKPIPMFNGVYGPVLSPTEYDIHLVLRWLAAGLDVREAMEDGSYRKLKANDEKLMQLLDEKNKRTIEERNRVKAERQQIRQEIKPQGNVRLPEEKKQHKPVEKKQEPKKKEVEKKQEPKKKEEPKQPAKVEEKNNLIIDNLEKPE